MNFEGKEPTFDNRALLSSFYIIGYSRVTWIEWFGWMFFFAVILFSIVHGALRLLGGRL